MYWEQTAAMLVEGEISAFQKIKNKEYKEIKQVFVDYLKTRRNDFWQNGNTVAIFKSYSCSIKRLLQNPSQLPFICKLLIQKNVTPSIRKSVIANW